MLVELESDEKIFDILSSFDEELILEILVLIIDIENILDKCLVFLSEIAVVFDFHNLSFISLEIILNFVPGLEISLAITL